MRLANKVAVITVSGRGIGRGAALAMAKEGAKIVVNDIDLKPAEGVMQEIKRRDGQAVVNREKEKRGRFYYFMK